MKSVQFFWNANFSPLLPEHSSILFRVRKQTFSVSVRIFRESEVSSYGQKKALLPLSSCPAEQLCHSLALEAVGTGLGRREQVLVAGGKEQSCLVRSDEHPVLVSGTSSCGGLPTLYTMRWMHGQSKLFNDSILVSVKAHQSLFSMLFSHKAAINLDSCIAELVVPSAMASAVSARLWPMELTLKQM